MKIVTANNRVSLAELNEMAEKMFGTLVKAVVDAQRGIMAIDGELHADEEALLMENGSRRSEVWGINIYPQFEPNDERFIEFDSLINIKPSLGNRSRGVDNPQIRQKISHIARSLIV